MCTWIVDFGVSLFPQFYVLRGMFLQKLFPVGREGHLTPRLAKFDCGKYNHFFDILPVNSCLHLMWYRGVMA